MIVPSVFFQKEGEERDDIEEMPRMALLVSVYHKLDRGIIPL